MRSAMWRFAVAPSNAASKNCNIAAQLQSLRCIIAPKLFWKIYSLYDFWCAQTCSFRAVFGLPVRSFTIICCRCYILSCASTLLAINYPVEFSSNPSAICTKSCAKPFPPILDFSQFLTAISRKLWRHLTT